MKKNKAFTLIEILVVITIIGLLSSIVLVAIKSTKEKARIVKILQFAAQVYHALGADAVGIWDFDEGDGTTVNDRSGNNNNGTLINGPVWKCASANPDYTPSGKGCSLEFDGSNDYVRIDSVVVSSPTSLTISAWFKKESGGANYECALHQSSNTTIGGSSYWLGVDSDDYLTATIGARTGVGWDAGRTNIKANYGMWYYLVASWDGSTVKVYVNGKYIKKYSLTSYSNLTTPTRIGASGDGTGYLFRGNIDEVRIYKESLTQAQIQKLYAEGLKEHNLVSK